MCDYFVKDIHKNMHQKQKSDKRLLQSITRAEDILSLFIQEKHPLGISDFARKLGLAKTTIQGIVNTLTALHYLEQDPVSSKYRLGARLFQLGLTYAANMDMLSTIRVWIERLSFQFSEPVNVGMLVGKRVLVLFRAEPDKNSRTFPHQGSVIPAHTTAIGKMLFAHMSEDRLRKTLEGYDYTALTENSITGPEQFMKELEQVRREGVSFDNEENFIGLAGIGGPIYNHTGQVIAAFALTGDAEHIGRTRDAIISEVRFTSKEISSQFGWKK